MSEEELKHYVDEYFEKYWSVSFDKYLENREEADEICEWALQEVKRLKNKNEELKDQLDFSNNIINELEKWLEQEYAVVKANSIQEPGNSEWYIKWNERKNILDKLQELKDRTYNNLGGIYEKII